MYGGAESRMLFGMGMLILIFNVIMVFGVNDYINTSGLAQISCGDVPVSDPSNITVIEFQDLTITQCVSDQAFLINSIIVAVNLIVLGVMVYLFIPFVK